MVSHFQNFLPATVMCFMLKTLNITGDIALHIKFSSLMGRAGWIVSPSGKRLWWVPADFRGNISGSLGTLAVWNNLHIVIFRAI
jgi:hypothetical protein